MKRTLFISVSILLSLCWSVAAGAQSQIHTVASTEGYEFFGAFLPNGSSYANTPDLKLQLVFSCREMPGVTQNNVTIQLYEGNNLRTRTVQVPVPGTTTYTFSTADAARVYWVNNKGKTDEETVVNKGFRIYSTNNVPMTVYAVNQIGDKAGTYSFDGAHLLPRQVLGYEYLAACHADEAISTEFVVMSTRTGETNVTVTLPKDVSTYTGKTGTVTIKFTRPYQTYIIRSKEGADLSGAQICADKGRAYDNAERHDE